MSLSTALRIAQNSIFNTSFQTSVTSRNISEVGNANYTQRSVELISRDIGSTASAAIRNQDQVLLRNNLTALSASAGQAVISNGASRLSSLINGADNSSAPSTFLTKFENALQLYSTDPSNVLAGNQTVAAAKDLANGISDASNAIQQYRGSLDLDISDGVAKVNSLLEKFEALNKEVVKGTATRTDVNNALDEREAVLKELSQYISLTSVTRHNNDQVLYTADGVTLFETQARDISFNAVSSYAPGTTGNQIYIDGVPLAAGSGARTDAIGSLAAMLQMRDDVAVTAQGQLDELARGLVVQFSETDQASSGAPVLAGLFTYSGGPAVPNAATAINGISLSLKVNAAFDPSLGGSSSLLRDGGANGANYVQNTNGGVAYSNRLISFIENIDEKMAMDPSFGLIGNYSVSGYAQASIGWLDGVRSQASSAAESKSALSDRLTSMLSSKTGVNLDEELSTLIELEQSYQAAARIMSVVDDMYTALFASMR